ncbi:UDP-glucuronosyltransferase 1A8-like [Eriocheir sinensis]|uniref:UDP-glucuronosyltransferase 1A8-like n=1 Tax=Eriocheir sinensis TaxID=95602 RepID=UPI0021C6919D|nr:UDP-glucuronosyltransferase 1A8-like [Eriocheir sinensis]
MLWERPRRLWQVPLNVFSVVGAHCLTLLGDAALFTHLYQANFTVALVDVIANECSLALAHRLGLPVVAFWGFSFQGGEAKAMGVFQSPAIVPAFMSDVGAEMGFRERVWNTLMSLAESALIAYHRSNTDYYIQRLAPHVPLSHQLLREVEAVLVHSHWLLDHAKLMPPHVQYLGCIQCGPPAPLPHPLHAWMNGSGEAGVILFSLGYTGFEASAVPGEVMGAFLNAFARLQQRVLLRFNPALLPTTPDNVMVMDWLPQHDILGHPKTVLFVSHCGQSGMNEAVYHGVPLVAVPIFADQGDNARRVAERGLGVAVDKTEISEERIYSAITTVLRDPKYRQTARRFSRLWKDEVEAGESGLEVAVRWVEKVHNHGRLTHLRLPGAHLSFLQYFAIDVAALLVMVVLLPLCLVHHCVCRRCFKRELLGSSGMSSKLKVN